MIARVRAAGAELWGLFVGDVDVALSVIVWIGALALAPYARVPAEARGFAFFGGLVLILIATSVRSAAKR